MNQINDDENDERIVCKYGASCYQKNKAHHEKYKHPSGDDQHEEKENPQIKKPTGPLKQQKLNIFFKKVIPKTEKVEKLEESKRDEDNVTSSSSRANTTEKLENTRNQISPSPSPDHTQNFENIGKTELSPSLSSNISSDDLTNRIKTEISPSSSGSTSEEEHGETEDNEAETSSSYYEISEEDSKILIKKLFLVDMPPDFYSFWSFCKKLSPENPKEALSSVGLTLVGPYDVIAGELKENSIDSSEALIHWRYYYDPPEFQTIIKGNENCFHMGYFRDDPNMPPVFVAYNSAKENPHITPVAENIFGAVDWYVSRSEKASNPFKKIKTSNLKSSLHDWAKTHKFTLDKYSPSMQKRNKAAVCKTFQQVGIVVPYDKKTEVGYRPLSENTKNLKHILNEIVKAKTKEERIAHFNSLYSVVNWANIAMDEGDFGTNLELGLNLFSYETDQFNSIILSCLGTAYNLLGRNQFEAIIKAHLNNRRKGDNLSVIKKSKK